MRAEDCVRAVGRLCGVMRAETLPDDMLRTVAGIESSIMQVSGGMRIECSGMGVCSSMGTVLVLFCDDGFPRPSEVTMEMVDDRGTVIGQDVPLAMRGSFEGRDDVCWISDGFVLFPRRIDSHFDVRMVLHESRVHVPDAGPGVDARVFYPSPESANLLNSWFGMSCRGMSTLIMGVDGLDASVPVTDMVQVPCGGRSHGEPSPEHTLYRGRSRSRSPSAPRGAPGR